MYSLFDYYFEKKKFDTCIECIGKAELILVQAKVAFQSTILPYLNEGIKLQMLQNHVVNQLSHPSFAKVDILKQSIIELGSFLSIFYLNPWSEMTSLAKSSNGFHCQICSFCCKNELLPFNGFNFHSSCYKFCTKHAPIDIFM